MESGRKYTKMSIAAESESATEALLFHSRIFQSLINEPVFPLEMKTLTLISSLRDIPRSRDHGEVASPPGSAAWRNAESRGPRRPSCRPFYTSTVGLNSCRCAELLQVIAALPPHVTSSSPTLCLWRLSPSCSPAVPVP